MEEFFFVPLFFFIFSSQLKSFNQAQNPNTDVYEGNFFRGLLLEGHFFFQRDQLKEKKRKPPSCVLASFLISTFVEGYGFSSSWLDGSLFPREAYVQ